MLINEIMLDEKILIITPEGALESADFKRLTEEVDPFIEAMGTLNGLIDSFQGFLLIPHIHHN